jgi:hypothetical protein
MYSIGMAEAGAERVSPVDRATNRVGEPFRKLQRSRQSQTAMRCSPLAAE